MVRLIAASLFFVASACQETSRAPQAEQTTTPLASKPTPPSQGSDLELFRADDRLLFRLKKREGGYKILDNQGTKVGKLKVQEDRVKVSDNTGQPRGKIKKRDYGFKVIGPTENTIFKAKIRGENRLKLVLESGTLVGKLKGPKGTLGSQEATAKEEAGKVVVRLGSQAVCKTTGLSPTAALVLAAPGIDDYQRMALGVFLREVF